MLIPWQALPQATLMRLLEEFITREGTDYGLQEYTLAEKVEQIMCDIKSGNCVIVFDQDTESTTLMLQQDYQARC